MRRAGDGVFRDAGPRREETRHEVDAAAVTFRRDDDPARVERSDGGKVRCEGPYRLRCVHLDKKVEATPAAPDRLGAQRFGQAIRKSHLCWWCRGKVEHDPV